MSHGCQIHTPWQLMPSLWIRLIIFYTLFPPSASYHNFCKNWKWISTSYPDCPQLANTAMVSQACKTLDSEVTPPAQTHEQCPSTIQPRTTPAPGQPASSDGLSVIRKSLQSRGISQATQGTILNSWRTATQKQYQVYLEKWQSFADKRAVDSLHPPVNDVLEFLQELYARGLGYSCLNTARSALSSFIVLDGNITVGNHPLVHRFLKGVFQTRPDSPPYTSTLDTSIVLIYLKTLDPLKDISLQNLTHKLVMLCALVTGQRCQTLIS